MPNLDGVEAARRVYAERPMPIVMLTAYADRKLGRAGDRRRCVLLPRRSRSRRRTSCPAIRRRRGAPRRAARGSRVRWESARSRSRSRSPRAAATSGRSGCGRRPDGTSRSSVTSQCKVMPMTLTLVKCGGAALAKEPFVLERYVEPGRRARASCTAPARGSRRRCAEAGIESHLRRRPARRRRGRGPADHPRGFRAGERRSLLGDRPGAPAV